MRAKMKGSELFAAAMLCAKVVAVVTENVASVGGSFKRRLRGPNVCGSRRHQCCHGWTVNAAHGLCTVAVCQNGCGDGVCSRPDVCWCPGRYFSQFCGGNRETSIPRSYPRSRHVPVRRRPKRPVRQQTSYTRNTSSHTGGTLQQQTSPHQRQTYRQWLRGRSHGSPRMPFRHPTLWKSLRRPVVAVSNRRRANAKEYLDMSVTALDQSRNEQSVAAKQSASEHSMSHGSRSGTKIDEKERQIFPRTDTTKKSEEGTKYARHSADTEQKHRAFDSRKHYRKDGVIMGKQRLHLVAGFQADSPLDNADPSLEPGHQNSGKIMKKVHAISQQKTRHDGSHSAKTIDYENVTAAQFLHSAGKSNPPTTPSTHSSETKWISTIAPDDGEERQGGMNFKEMKNKKLRSQLSDPRLRTLFRALGARRRGLPHPKMSRPPQKLPPKSQTAKLSLSQRESAFPSQPLETTTTSAGHKDSAKTRGVLVPKIARPPSRLSPVSHAVNLPLSQEDPVPTIQSLYKTDSVPTSLGVETTTISSTQTERSDSKTVENSPLGASDDQKPITSRREEKQILSVLVEGMPTSQPDYGVAIHAARQTDPTYSSDPKLEVHKHATTSDMISATEPHQMAQKDSRYVETTTQSSRLRKEDLKSLFPGHQIIDLDIRYRPRIVLPPETTEQPTSITTPDRTTTDTMAEPATTKVIAPDYPDQPDIKNTENQDGCRDDLCRNSTAAEQLLDGKNTNENGEDSDSAGSNPESPSPLDVECPPGHRRALRNKYIVCEALRATFANETEDRLCNEDEELVLLPRGRADCVPLIPGPRSCGEGEILLIEGGRRVCKPVTTATVQACPEGQIMVILENGYQCQFVTEAPVTSQPTLPTTQQARCPQGQREINTNTGPLCLPEYFATTVASVKGHECPDGMTAVETSIGVFCLFVGDFVVSRAPPATTTTTSTTETPTTTNAVLPECPEGMTVIQIPSGQDDTVLHVCGFEAGPPRTLQCPEDQNIVEEEGGYGCRPLHQITDKAGPCPAGQELTRTENGVVCQYRSTNRAVDILGYHSCVRGQILTQTPSGFFCQELSTSETTLHEVIPDCSLGYLAVKVNSGDIICLPQYEARLRCPKDNMELERTSAGFFCQRKEMDLTKKCEKGEILIIDGDRTLCQRLEKNGHLCGEGYKPQLTDDGFMCKAENVPLNCPKDFVLSGVDGQAGHSCRAQDVGLNICQDVHFRKIFGDRVVCKEGNLSGVLVPCGDGYHVTDSDAGPLCELDDYVTVLCEEDSEGDVTSCTVQPARSCKNDVISDEGSSSKKKGCREIRLAALSGCRPRCANGGRCHRGKCVCPPGLDGKACHIDIDECQKFPLDFCQYGCLNTFGSFRCMCPHNATLNADGRTCQYTECVPRCMNGGLCQNGMCQCPQSFTGAFCQEDLDECKSESHSCDHLCLNTVGSFMCVCRPGSRLAADGRSCINTTCIPECRNGGRCENHRCICPPGLTGIVCQLDVNECSGSHGCSHKCHNSYGSFRCSCPRDLILANDGKTCIDRHNRGQPSYSEF